MSFREEEGGRRLKLLRFSSSNSSGWLPFPFVLQRPPTQKPNSLPPLLPLLPSPPPPLSPKMANNANVSCGCWPLSLLDAGSSSVPTKLTSFPSPLSSSLAQWIYRTLFQKNSIYLAGIFSTAFAFSIGYDIATTKIFNEINAGVSPPSLFAPSSPFSLSTIDRKAWKRMRWRRMRLALSWVYGARGAACLGGRRGDGEGRESRSESKLEQRSRHPPRSLLPPSHPPTSLGSSSRSPAPQLLLLTNPLRFQRAPHQLPLTLPPSAQSDPTSSFEPFPFTSFLFPLRSIPSY